MNFSVNKGALLTPPQVQYTPCSISVYMWNKFTKRKLTFWNGPVPLNDTLYDFNKIAPSLVYLNMLKMLKTLSVGICDVSVYTFMEAISM